jgi:hypothetical protein
LLTAISISFHLTHLAVGLAIGVGSCLAWAVWPAIRRQTRPLLALAPVVLGFSFLAASSLALYGQVSLTPKSPPHFMARLIADGPGRAYLVQACPTRHFEICRYLDRLPQTEDELLWRLLPSLPRESGGLIRDQQGEVVRGTISSFPLSVVGHMLANTARQLVTVESTVQFEPSDWRALETRQPFYADEVLGTLQARGQLGGLLAGFNAVHGAVALASLLASVWLASSCIARGLWRPAVLIGTILFGLVVNAFASGALGGVFGRYEGRVVWLLPFGALAAGLVLARYRAPMVWAAARTE